ncbi:MAG TPA: helix-turn-helix transcriptional regulator [Methylomirabilota bacterium]|nr:helix-turn-helix transcriptional regulator [Methylomirabilota bacterium]
MTRNGELVKSRVGCVSVGVAQATQSSDAANGPAAKLTAAEKKVLALVSRAKTNKEIAAVLGISPATVKRHLENVLRKLALKNRIEAAIYGLIADGCPRGSNPACPLKLWQKERDDAATLWAI